MDISNTVIVSGNSFSPDSVFGESIINHKARVILNLSCTAYCICQYMRKRAEKNGVIRWPDDHETNKELGMTGITELAMKDEELKRFIAYREDLRRFIFDVKTWDEAHGSSSDTAYPKEFEALWIRYGKVGNKYQAFKAYKTAIKRVDYSKLKEAIDRYNRYVEKTGWIAKKHFSTFLNSREYEQQYEEPKERDKYIFGGRSQ